MSECSGTFDLEGQGNKIVYCELALIILVLYEESSSSKNEGSGLVLLLWRAELGTTVNRSERDLFRSI